MKSIYKEWSGYYSGILAFIMLSYFLFLLKPNKEILLIASVLFFIMFVICFLVTPRVIASTYVIRASRAFGILSIITSLMCLLGAFFK